MRSFWRIFFTLAVFSGQLLHSSGIQHDEEVKETEFIKSHKQQGDALCNGNELLQKLDHFEDKFLQLENLIKRIVDTSHQRGLTSEIPTYETLSSKLLNLETKLLRHEQELKRLIETRTMRSINFEDTSHESLLSKIDILENRLSQQNDDIKQSVEATLESKFQQLESSMRKTMEVTIASTASNESAETSEVLLTKVNHLQDKLSQFENVINKTIHLANRTTADSFGFEVLRLKIDFQEVKLLQLTNEINNKNEKIVKSLTHLENLYEVFSGDLNNLSQNFGHSISSMMNESSETLHQLEIDSNKSFKQVLLRLDTVKKLNDEIEKQNEKVMQKLDSLETLSLKVPELFINLKQLIDQNLSKVLNNSSEISKHQTQSCISNEDLKQTIFDMIILKNSARYFQVATLHQSCKDSKLKKKSGQYLLHPDPHQEPFEGFCEQDKFEGGWLVIQHRFNGSVDFYRDWVDYKNGFGAIGGEFWLGLETVHRLTRNKNFTLLIEMEDFNGAYGYAKYDRFEIGSEDEWYSLKRLGSYSGTAGDGLQYSLGMNFTTRDSDNDQSNENCAVQRNGAWWYKSCTFSNLNGKYQKIAHHQSLCWYYFKNTDEGLKVSRMMIREN